MMRFVFDRHFATICKVGLIVLFLTANILVTTAIRGWDAPVDPVIVVETPVGVATISGPGAEYVLHSAFPVVSE